MHTDIQPKSEKKTRKELPCYGYIDGMTVDVPKVLKYLEDNKLLDFKEYNDIHLSNGGNFEGYVRAHEYVQNNFFKDADTPSLEGDKFRQIQLTQFDTSKSKGMPEIKETTELERQKRLDPNSPNYLPEADEYNYGVRGPLVKGVLEEILDMFKGKITRARLAFLDAGHEIKPHYDYDTAYITRYHIALLTQPEVKFFTKRSGRVFERHIPADGRVYFLNAGYVHWVKNDSSGPRLHLIIDCAEQYDLDNLVSLDEETA
jgi:quercetin dioxygenase-like cupin family protein